MQSDSSIPAQVCTYNHRFDSSPVVYGRPALYLVLVL